MIFMHIPKCGGTTVRHLVEFQSAGHWPLDEIRRRYGDAKVATVIREPKSRILSAYYYGRSHTWEYISKYPKYSDPMVAYDYHGMAYKPCKQYELLDYLNSERDQLTDYYVKWLGHGGLTDVDLIGTTENMGKFLGSFGVNDCIRLKSFDSIHNFPLCEKIKKQVITPEIDSLLDEITANDQAIYKEVLHYTR